jgi:hypothetical protein
VQQKFRYCGSATEIWPVSRAIPSVGWTTPELNFFSVSARSNADRRLLDFPSSENSNCGLAPQAKAPVPVNYHNIAPGFDM